MVQIAEHRVLLANALVLVEANFHVWVLSNMWGDERWAQTKGTRPEEEGDVGRSYVSYELFRKEPDRQEDPAYWPCLHFASGMLSASLLHRVAPLPALIRVYSDLVYPNPPLEDHSLTRLLAVVPVGAELHDATKTTDQTGGRLVFEAPRKHYFRMLPGITSPIDSIRVILTDQDGRPCQFNSPRDTVLALKFRYFDADMTQQVVVSSTRSVPEGGDAENNCASFRVKLSEALRLSPYDGGEWRVALTAVHYDRPFNAEQWLVNRTSSCWIAFHISVPQFVVRVSFSLVPYAREWKRASTSGEEADLLVRILTDGIDEVQEKVDFLAKKAQEDEFYACLVVTRDSRGRLIFKSQEDMEIRFDPLLALVLGINLTSQTDVVRLVSPDAPSKPSEVALKLDPGIPVTLTEPVRLSRGYPSCQYVSTDFTESIVCNGEMLPLLKLTNLDLSSRSAAVNKTFKRPDFVGLNRLPLRSLSFRITDEYGQAFKVDDDATVYFNLLFVQR
jgi:hypothetical protein